jgi:hypothetical protein
MNMKIALKVLVIAVISTAQAHALTIAEYEAKYGTSADSQTRTAFWSGISDTITTFRVMREKDGLKQLYCPPPSVQITSTNLMNMTDQVIKKASEGTKSKDAKNFPITDLALITLMGAFPCK